MSHYSVAVFSQSPDQVDELLAPYCESVEPGSPYAVFEEHADAEVDAITGRHGYWLNPNARWDWYTIGGRWQGLLKLRDGVTGRYGNDYDADERERCRPIRCDIALAADCDFRPNEEERRRALRFWEIHVEGKLASQEEEEAFFSPYKPEYFIDQYGTKELYAECQAEFLTYAFVSPDGIWHETGHMGWWGIDDATAESHEAYRREFAAALASAVEQGLYITVVDCHI